MIVLQPLGSFAEEDLPLLEKVRAYAEIFFGTGSRVEKPLPLPERGSRLRQYAAGPARQYLTSAIMNDVLLPGLPEDAICYLGVTMEDLYPEPSWNFVFGQASLRERVGVWSIYRNGDPDESDDAFRLCLVRTIKTATHEVGHMFSLHHCTQYECNMCGSNSLRESDSRPIWLCPECLAKILWAAKADAVKRDEKLAEFAEKNGLKEEQLFFEKSIKLLTE